MIQVEVDESRCTGDGICVEFCPFSVFELRDRNGRNVATAIHSQACTACYTCVGQCSMDAITLYLVEEGLRDV